MLFLILVNYPNNLVLNKALNMPVYYILVDLACQYTIILYNTILLVRQHMPVYYIMIDLMPVNYTLIHLRNHYTIS